MNPRTLESRSSVWDRRTFLKALPLAGFSFHRAAFGAAAWTSAATAAAALARARHFPATVTAPTELSVPVGKRTPFNWDTTVIGETPIQLRWSELPGELTPSHLRLCVGLDVRDEKRIEAFLPVSGRLLGVFDVRYASLFQMYEVALAAADAAAIRQEGICLRLVQGGSLRIFTGRSGNAPVEMQVHLLVPGRQPATEEFFARLGSRASLQPWGWNEGCVLDGLLDLAVFRRHSAMEEVARRHLAIFLPRGTLVYEDPTSVPRDGGFYGIEGTLPCAALARIEPQHPLLDTVLRFWLGLRDADEAIIDGANTTSEGAYVVGYPLAVIARQRGDAALQALALAQLRTRHSRLFDGQSFWRTSHPGRPKENRNWARGVAWQLLGEARTLRELKNHPDTGAGVTSFQQLAHWIMPWQRSDGLWSVFVDEPTLTPDTAGSCGIAAALAIGAAEGWLDHTAREAAVRCLDGTTTHLTPDGFLGGVSQSNRGGEALQRSDYRVIYQMGMGLRAQLVAALTA